MGVRMKPERPLPGQKRRRRDPGTPQPSAAVTNASASDEKSASPDRTRTGTRALDGHLRSIRGGKLARDQAASTAVMRRLMLETFRVPRPDRMVGEVLERGSAGDALYITWCRPRSANSASSPAAWARGRTLPSGRTQ